MSNKSLDILEEQLFNLLNEYVPQTGRGFSDGNEYVGKKTKGPYEYVAEEDQPWYKKKYKKDSKNLKILIGHGSKTPKYAKKGGPFTQDPPKRRPVNKLSAPPVALDEVAIPQPFKDAFLKITNAEVSFKALKDIKAKIPIPNPFLKDVLVFQQGKTYKGTISGNDISLKATEDGDKTLTKQEFLEKLEAAEGDLCQNVDCDSSKIIANNKTLTFNQFIQQVKQPVEQPKPQTKLTGPEQEIAQKEANSVSNIGQRVASGSSIETAIKQEYGYNPITKTFAKEFYDTVTPALQKIEDLDEKKAAALTTIFLGEVTLIPVELVANVYSSIDPETIASLSGVVDNLLKQFAPQIMELKQKYQEIKNGIMKGKEAVEKQIEKAKDFTIGQNLNSIPPAKQGSEEILVFGNVDIIPSDDGFDKSIISGIASRLVGNKGYKYDETFESYDSIKELFDGLKNISNPETYGTILLYLKPEMLAPNTADELVQKIKTVFKNSNVVWIGAASSSNKQKEKMNPIQKGQETVSINAYNTSIRAASAGADKFIFIDPNDFIKGDADYIEVGEESYVGSIVGQRIYDGTKTEAEPEKKEEPVEKKENNKITVEATDLINPLPYIEGTAGVAKFLLLEKELKVELIKLSKRAKQVFGDKAKIYIQTGVSGHSDNHSAKEAVDMRISVDGTNKSAQETYAFIISSILDGTIKDGGVGYYANDTGIYDPNSMVTTSEYPHYDVRGVRKWFWFKCKDNKLENCPAGAKQRTREVEEKDADGNVIKDEKGKVKTKREPIVGQFQTVSKTAANVVNNNPLKLPRDVFSLMGSFSGGSQNKPTEEAKETKITGNNAAKLIEQRFTEAGLSKKLAYAAIVNSYYESRWNTRVLGDKAVDVDNECAKKIVEKEGQEAYCGGGLFGIHSCSGRGGCRATNTNAMSLDDIRDPEKSIAKIISHIKNDNLTGNILNKSKEEGVTVEDLVEYFCREVERPSRSNTKCTNRRSKTVEVLASIGVTDLNV